MLIYGGCHAQVLRDMLVQSLSADAWQVNALINFRLIASGEPFPYETLADYDVVIFSPIENKGDYNTIELRAYCASVGCRTISFPWLEWHGYCPGAQKGVFKHRFQWHYPQLSALAAEFSSFERYYDFVVANVPDDQAIAATLEMSTGMIRSAERRNETDIRVADFIVDRFRTSRLFMISDHPSLRLYRHVLDQILDALGVTAVADPAPIAGEPQWQIRTPILPRVTNQLGLDFDDAEWVDDDVLPGMSLSLRTYLSLYYHADSVIMAPRASANAFERDDGVLRHVPMTNQARLIARPRRTTMMRDDAEEIAGGTTLAEYELLEIVSGDRPNLGSNAHFAIWPDEWTSAWAVG